MVSKRGHITVISGTNPVGLPREKNHGKWHNIVFDYNQVYFCITITYKQSECYTLCYTGK